MSDVSITDLIADARLWAPCAMTPESQKSLLTRLADALEAVTVPPENEQKRMEAVALAALDNTVYDGAEGGEQPILGYLNVPAIIRRYVVPAILAAGFRLPVPVEPEYEYRRRHNQRGFQPQAIFVVMPALDEGEWAQRRTVGEWEDIA